MVQTKKLLGVGWIKYLCQRNGLITLYVLNHIVSNLFLILLKNICVNWGPKPFEVINAWLTYKSFKELVEKTWEQMAVDGRAT